MPNYTVRKSECISSIAKRYGFFADTIWNHPGNAKLKEQRKDPNVLYAGDVVFLPEKEIKEESRTTEARHRFRMRGVPAKFVLQLLDEDEPRAGVSYVLQIDGETFSGQTDQDGKLEHKMPPDAKRGKLTVEGTEEYDLDLGGLDPVSEDSGVRARLENLGFLTGDSVEAPEELEAAIKAFQKAYDLEVTGAADEPTRQKLLDVHGY